MKTNLKVILIPFLVSVLSVWGLYNFVPLSWLESTKPKNVGSTITSILSTDTLKDSRAVINTNFSNLNTDKLQSGDTAASLTITTGTIGTLTLSNALGVASGGTASTTLSLNQILLGNGTSGFKTVNGFGTLGQFLVSNGSGQAPSWATGGVDEALSYDWTGLHTFAATTTFQGNNIVSRYIFGDGQDGNLTLSSAVDVNKIRSTVTSAISLGATSFTVSSSTAFTAGDKVLIWQTVGTNAGIFEIMEIASKNSNTLTVSTSFKNEFQSTGAQVIKMNEYAKVSVTAGGSFDNAQWDGETGGVVAFFASEGVVASSTASINLNGYGFRGGAGCNNSCVGFRGENVLATTTSATQSNGGGNGGGGGQGSAAGANTGGGGGNLTYGASSDGLANGGISFFDFSGLRTSRHYRTPLMWFGGGGGGGGATAGASGTAGGDGGGVLLIVSPMVNWQGGLTLRGNTGVQSNSTNAGSGGNGGAGTAIFVTNAFSMASSTDVVSANIDSSGTDPQTIGGKGSLYEVNPVYSITPF